MKAIIYCYLRGDSWARHEEECRKYSKKHRYHVIGEYHDQDLANTADDPGERPQLWEALDAVPQDGALVVPKRMHLCDDPYVVLAIERVLRGRRAILEPVYRAATPDPGQQFFEALMAAERKVTNWRSSADLLRRQRAGLRVSGMPPFGMCVHPTDPARLEKHPGEQNAILRVIELNDDGHGPTAIARYLTVEEYPSRSGTWYPATVSAILRRIEQSGGPHG